MFDVLRCPIGVHMHQYPDAPRETTWYVNLQSAEQRCITPPEPASCLRRICALEVGCHSEHYARYVVYSNMIGQNEGFEKLPRCLEYELPVVGFYDRGPANPSDRHIIQCAS